MSEPIEFSAPVVLVLDSGSYHVTYGTAVVLDGALVGPGSSGHVSFVGVFDVEVDELHDTGCPVYEHTSIFQGYWKVMELA